MSERLKETGNSRNAKIMHDIREYHTPPADVIAIAAEANVKKLVLHHFAPPPDIRIVKTLYKKELKAYDGPIYFAEDGDLFVVE